MTENHHCACGTLINQQTPRDYQVMTQWGEVIIVRCSSCGLAQSQDFPNNEELDKLYKSQAIYNPPSDEEFAWLESSFGHIAADLEKLGIQGQRVLEIGCNAGYALSALTKAGYQAVGIEWNPDCVTYAREQQGLRVYQDIKEINPDEKFDVLFLSHIIEHITELDDFLKNLLPYLADDGVIYIKVPNYGSTYAKYIAKGDWHNFLPMQHVWYFEKKSLSNLLVNYGYSPLLLKTRIFAGKTNKFNTTLSGAMKTVYKALFGHYESMTDQGQEIAAVFRKKT